MHKQGDENSQRGVSIQWNRQGALHKQRTKRSADESVVDAVEHTKGDFDAQAEDEDQSVESAVLRGVQR
jgi:hypothetical protein